MPLLPNTRCGPPAPETSCDFLFDIGSDLIEAALVGLAPYLPEPDNACGDTFETYVSMGQPVAELYDALSVYLVSYGLTPESSGWQGRHSRDVLGVSPQFQAVWDMALLENCYPVAEKNAEGDIIYLPTADALHDVNRYVYAHGIGAYDALSVAITQGTLPNPVGPTGRPRVEKHQLGPMLPQGPQGAAVGWRWQITTVMDV